MVRFSPSSVAERSNKVGQLDATNMGDFVEHGLDLALIDLERKIMVHMDVPYRGSAIGVPRHSPEEGHGTPLPAVSKRAPGVAISRGEGVVESFVSKRREPF